MAGRRQDINDFVGHFRRYGYVVLRGAIERHLIEEFVARVEHHIDGNPDLSFMIGGQMVKGGQTSPQDLKRRGARVIDLEVHEPLAARLFLHSNLAGFLKALYGTSPTAIQTLTYKFSSRQGAHSDLFLVSPRSVGPTYDRSSLVASWISCDTVNESNGALIFYPESHKFEKKRLKDSFDGDYRRYRVYLEETCQERGLEPERFHAEPGDVLFWHGDLVHAGGEIIDPDKTRYSVVTHYCRLDPSVDSKNPERKRHTLENGSYFA